jgi:hypothetical protein
MKIMTNGYQVISKTEKSPAFLRTTNVLKELMPIQ